MVSVLLKYSMPIDDLIIAGLNEVISNKDYTYMMNTFEKYANSYKKKHDEVSVISELTNITVYLESSIEKKKVVETECLEKIVDLNFPESNHAYANYYLKEIIKLNSINQMYPEPLIDIESSLKLSTQDTGQFIQLYQLISFFLFTRHYPRSNDKIPENWTELHIDVFTENRLLSWQNNRIKHQVNKDVVDNIIEIFMNDPKAQLPQSFEQFQEKIDDLSPQDHGNKNTDYDDEIIERELKVLLEDGKYIHQGKLKGKANVNALVKKLFRTTFKDVDSNLSQRQMTRRVKGLLPDHLK